MGIYFYRPGAAATLEILLENALLVVAAAVAAAAAPAGGPPQRNHPHAFKYFIETENKNKGQDTTGKRYSIKTLLP